MRLVITVDIDTEESGLNPDEVKDNIVEFTRDLLIIGAEEQGIGLTLKEVEDRSVNYQQAIHCLKKDYDEAGCDECKFYHDCTHETIADIARLAVPALEKQIPKRPVDDTAFGSCPNCHSEFNSELINEYDMKYCLYCGQALE